MERYRDRGDMERGKGTLRWVNIEGTWKEA